MWRGRDRSRSAGPQYGRPDRMAMPYDRHPPPDQYFERMRAEPHYPDSRRAPPHFNGDGGYPDRYDRGDPYMMQSQPGFHGHPRDVPYSGHPRDMTGPNSGPRPGRTSDRGPRFPVQQQRVPKGAGFGGPQRAGHDTSEKNRMPQEAYIKRQSIRWLIKQRVSQVRKALNALDAAKAERTEEGKRIMAKPIPGLMMGDVKTDFELTFGQNLVYSELGHKKLREVIVNECGDFLKPPADQYVMEMAEGSTKIAGAEHRAASKCKLPSGKVGRPDLVPGLSAVVSKSLRYCGYSPEDIEKQVAAAIAAREAGAAGSAAKKAQNEKNEASGSKGKSGTTGGKADSALAKSNANVMGVQSDDDMDDVILVEDDEDDVMAAEDEPTAKSAAAAEGEAATETVDGEGAVQAGGQQEGNNETEAGAGATKDAAMDEDAVEVAAEVVSQETRRIAVPADPNKVHASIPSTFWDSPTSLDMSPALRDFIGTVRTKISHISCDTLLPCPFSPALLCPRSAAPVGWHPDEEASEDFKVVRRLRVNEVPEVPMDKGSTRAALDAANLLPKATPPHQRKLKGKAIWTNACDVSDLLEYSYADCLIMSQQSPDAESADCIPEIEEAIKASPEWILGLAALPLQLRKIPDTSNPDSARYIVVQQDDRVGPDVCAGLRRLRQAVVVCMLDAVPSVRSIMNADTVESSVIALGEPPDDLPCLRSSTVIERIEKMLGKELISLLLTSVRCDTLEMFIDSVHCCDLVCRMPHPDELEPVLCSRFSPLGDLRNSLDMRLRRIASEMTEKAEKVANAATDNAATNEAVAATEAPSGTATGTATGTAADDKKNGTETAVNSKGGKGTGPNKRERQRMKRWGAMAKKTGTDGHTFRLLALLRDHQLMWGYGFQPLFCGASTLSETVSVFLPDMVVNADPAGGASAASANATRWVNVSAETLMRYLIQDRLQQAEIAMVDAEEKQLQPEVSGSDTDHPQADTDLAEVTAPQEDSEMNQNENEAAAVVPNDDGVAAQQGDGEKHSEVQGDDATDDEVAVVAEPMVTVEGGDAVVTGVKEEQQEDGEGKAAEQEDGSDAQEAVEAAAATDEAAVAEAQEGGEGDKHTDTGAGEAAEGTDVTADGDKAQGEAAEEADQMDVEKQPETDTPADGEQQEGNEEPAAGGVAAQEGEAATDADQNAEQNESIEAEKADAPEKAAAPVDGDAADAEMQAEEQENVKEVPVAGDSAAVDTDANATTADGAANEPKESAITPVTGEDGALQVQATIEGWRGEYKAKYGQDHPAKTDEELVASLNALRWLFHVTWDQHSGFVTIGEIPQKLDFVADVSDTHRTNLMEFMDKALVQADSSVLHSFTPTSEVAHTAPIDAQPAADAAATTAKEKGAKETATKAKAGTKAAAGTKQTPVTDNATGLDVVIKEERVEDTSQVAGDSNKGTSTSSGAKKGSEGTDKELATTAKRKASAAKEKAPEKRQKAASGAAAATQASDARGTKGPATIAAPGGRRGSAAAGGAASKSNPPATAGRRGPFADPEEQGDYGNVGAGPKGQQRGAGASAAAGGVRGPFSYTSGANANRRSGAAAAPQGGPGTRGTGGLNNPSSRGGPGGSSSAAAGPKSNSRHSDAIRGSVRGRSTFEPAPRVSTLGDGRLGDMRRGASAGRMPHSRGGGPMGGVTPHRDMERTSGGGPRGGPRDNPPYQGYGGGNDRSRSRGANAVAGSRYGGGGSDMHGVGAYNPRSMHADDDVTYRGRNPARGDPRREDRHGPAPGAYNNGSTYRSNTHGPSRDVGRRMHADDAYGMHEQGVDLLDRRPMPGSGSRHVGGGRSDYGSSNRTNHATTNISNAPQVGAYSVVPAGASQPPPGVQYTEARLPDGQIIQVMLPASHASQEPKVLEPSDSRIYGASTTRYQIAQEPTYVTQVVTHQQPKQSIQGGGSQQRMYTTAVQDSSGGGYMHDMHDGGHRDYVDEPVGHALDAEGRAAMLAYTGTGGGVIYEAEPGMQRSVSGQQYSVQGLGGQQRGYYLS